VVAEEEEGTAIGKTGKREADREERGGLRKKRVRERERKRERERTREREGNQQQEERKELQNDIMCEGKRAGIRYEQCHKKTNERLVPPSLRV